MNAKTIRLACVLLALLAACSGGKKGNSAASGACLSDKDCRPQGKLCNSTTAACVQCLVAADCATSSSTDSGAAKGADCVAGACVSFDTCTSSLECKTNQVCDTTRGRCVECVGDTDCGAMATCVANVCRVSCQSDKDCVSRRQLCDFTSSSCVDCIHNADCPAGKYCNGGACSDQVCAPGGTSCTSNMLFVCSDNGTAWQNPTTCPIECRMTADGGICSDGSDAAAGSGGGAGAGGAAGSGTGGSSTGAGGSSTGGASGTGGAGGTIASGPCGDMIDDMEDGDGYICRGNGRIGQWYTAGNTSVMPSMDLHPTPPAQISPPRDASNWAMHMTAPMYYGTGSILGVDLQYDGTTVYGNYNASDYQGISFWARGTFADSVTGQTAIDVWVACAQTTPVQYGGTCPLSSSCYDNYTRVYLTTDWSQIQLPFSLLTGGYAAFDKTQVTHIQFRIVGSPLGVLDLWIDDLAFYR